MPETGSDNLNISISPDESPVLKDQTKRKEQLLRNRTILRIGERDRNYRDILILDTAFDAMMKYGMSDRTKEVAGIFAGFHTGDQTILTQFIPAESAQATAGQVNFSPDTWAELHRTNDRINQQHGTDDEIVAWFHSHPADYPPAPHTSQDQFIMQNYFSFADRKGPKDQATIIMTTYRDRPGAALAAWKWDAETSQAVYMKGISVARKTNDPVPAYYYQAGAGERRIGGSNEPFIELDASELPRETEMQKEGIRVTENKKTQEIHIQIPDESGGDIIRITLKDTDPDPDMIRITLADLPPEQTDALKKQLDKHPTRKQTGIFRLIREALGTPPTKKRKSIADEITILSED